MANFARTRADGVWVNGYEPPAADWADLDAKQRQAINGDRGGAWAPSSLLTVGDVGGSDPALVVNERTLVAYGGELRSAGTGRFQIPGSTWPEFAEGHPFRERKLVSNLFNAQGEGAPDWLVDIDAGGIASVALSIQQSGAIRSPGALRAPLRVHDGATLQRVTFCYRVPNARAYAPTAMPRFRVVRVTSASAESLKNTSTDSLGFAADADGWASPPVVTTPTQWMQGGAAQRFVYVCNQNNVIDVENYTYFVEVTEETGSATPIAPSTIDGIRVREKKTTVRLASATTPAGLFAGLLTVDGLPTAAGDRVLMKNGESANPLATNYNGIWIVNDPGLWTRAADFDAVADITPSVFVEVEEGVRNAGTTWELTSPPPLEIGSWPITFDRLTPRGNLYHSAVAEFDGIADMRFQ